MFASQASCEFSYPPQLRNERGDNSCQQRKLRQRMRLQKRLLRRRSRRRRRPRRPLRSNHTLTSRVNRRRLKISSYFVCLIRFRRNLRSIYWRGRAREKRTDNASGQEMDVPIWDSRHCWSWLLRIRVLAMDFAFLADAICDRILFCVIGAERRDRAVERARTWSHSFETMRLTSRRPSC